MSDAYGYINFKQSEDFECNYEEMLTALNQRCWTNDGSNWKIYYKNEQPIGFEIYGGWGGGKVQYPTVFPLVIIGMIVPSESDEIIPIDDFIAENYKNGFDILDDEETIENLVKLLAPFVTSGWFEISCHATEKGTSYMESFKLDYEGCGIRVRQVLGYYADPVNETFKLN